MRILMFVFSLLLNCPISATAEDWSEDQKAVWSVIETSTEAFKDEDWDTFSKFLSDDFYGWRVGAPMPNNKSSQLSWLSFYYQERKVLKYELFPVKIVIHGDTAVAHYFYESVEEIKDGEREQDNGHYMDILVRDGKSWKYFAY